MFHRYCSSYCINEWQSSICISHQNIESGCRETSGRRPAADCTDWRGLEKAGVVTAVIDGAPWKQGFIDFHCEAAVRILDFPHAGQRIGPFGDTVFGEGTPMSRVWLRERLHSLKHEGSTQVLVELRKLQAAHARDL